MSITIKTNNPLKRSDKPLTVSFEDVSIAIKVNNPLKCSGKSLTVSFEDVSITLDLVAIFRKAQVANDGNDYMLF
jgi:hypothetical protein